MKKGFTLIEIMISTVIAGILSAGLFATITQVNGLRQIIFNITSTYGRLSVFEQQMERDIMGAFVPTQYDLLPTQTDKKDEKSKPLEKIFYGESKGKGGRLDFLTFITSNPLEIFYGVEKIKLKPRVARVVYRLIPQEGRKDSYVLMRQEGTSDLTFDAYKKDAQADLRAYPMIDGIQNLSIRFISVEEKVDTENKSITHTYTEASNWKDIDSASAKASADRPKSPPPPVPRPRLPQYVQFTLSLWDSVYEKYKEFVMTIPVQSKYGQFEVPKKEEDDAKEKEKEKDAQAGQKE